MHAEDTQCSTQGVRFAVVVRHPVSVGKHTVGPETGELRTGSGSNCHALENSGRRADERRGYAVFGARCQISVQCRGVVRHLVSVGKHAIHIDYAHVRRRE